MKHLIYILFFTSLGFANEELPMYEYAFSRAVLENKHVAEVYLEMYESGEITDLPDCIGSANLWVNDFGQPYFATYFVATPANGGSTGNSGTAIGSPWTIGHALANDAAGDIVHVDAGNYGTTNYNISTSGTAGNYLRYLGYKDTPGDIVPVDGPSFEYGTDTYNANDYPTFVGNRTSHSGSGDSVTGGLVSGDGWTITGAYVEFNAIQIRNKDRGIITTTSADNSKIINCVIHEMGDYSSESGRGLVGQGDNMEIAYNSLVNVSHQGLVMGSDGSPITTANVHHNLLAADQPIGNSYSMDYYLQLTGCHNSTVSDNVIYRKPAQYHQGHGIIVKSTGTFNTFTDNIIRNTCYEFSFEGANNNTIRGGLVESTVPVDGGQNQHYAFVMVGNGSHDNLFENITFRGDVMLRFQDWDDGYNPVPNTDIVSAGYNNVYRNLLGIDIKEAIQFGWQWFGAGSADDNLIEHMVIDGLSDAFIRAERPNSGTIIRNSVIMNATATTYNENNDNPTQVRPVGTQYAADITYVNNYFHDIDFTVPGVSESGSDPLFTNEGAEDYSLQSGSPLRDAGSTATAGTLDFDGNPRDSNPDIGILEFGGGGPISVTSVKTYPTAIETAASTCQLYVDVFPLNADDQTGTWSSDNESVATVNSSGLVTRVGDGQADIEFESTDGDFTDTSSITFNSGYTQDAFEAIGPKLYLTPESLDPDVTTDGNPVSVWEDMSGSGLNAIPQGVVDLNVSANRMAEFDGVSYFTVPDDSSLDLEPGTDEIYLAVREGDVLSTAGGYLVSKAGASNRQYGISMLNGELQGVYVGGTFSAFTNVPVATNRLVEVMISTTDVDAYVDGVQVLDGGTIGTSTNDGQQVNIGGRTNGSYLMTAGSHIDYVVIDDEIPESGELSDIQDQFNFNVESDNDPVITLLGSTPVNITTADDYTDAGATAFDVEDGDITEDIVVGGDTVNDDAPGTYVITYNVDDSDANAATEKTRTVNVSAVNASITPGVGPNGEAYYIQDGTNRYYPN